ncbi:MAG TPA: post-COAP-1 domain-containing protein [Chthoniobacterales bacterium]
MPRRSQLRLGPTWILLFIGAVCAQPGRAVDVLTWHNDLARTGQNLSETTLTLVNVNSTDFGKLFAIPVDGQVYAQPLVVSTLSIAGLGVRDVVYVGTEHDTVYAADANTGAIIWQQSLLPPGETPADTQGCTDLTPELGITATPVIDRSSGPHGTIYVVGASKNAQSSYFQRLHALDLTTGAEEFSGPVTITASYPGIGAGSQGGQVIFDPAKYTERAGLVLSGGIIYLTWASHCDHGLYTSWVLGHDEATLAQVRVLNLTQNGSDGAIWSCGAVAVDASGSLYAITGNGTFDTTPDPAGFPNQGDYGNCLVKILPGQNALQLIDYWTMFNTVDESNMDEDFGAGGVVLLPDMTDSGGLVRHLAVGAGKDSHIYIADRDNLGKFDSTSNGTLYQDLPDSLGGARHEFGSPAYFNGALYFGAHNDMLRAFSFHRALLDSVASSTSATGFPFPGTTPSISANGQTDGIVWALQYGSVGILRAYDATDLSRELYNSNQMANGRDQFGAGTKFAVPTIANGRVYVGGSGGVVAVFGLLGAPTPTPTPTPTVTPTTTPSATPTPTQVSGSGTVNGSSGQASFSITGVGRVTGRRNRSKITGSFSYSDPAVPLTFSAKKITSVALTGNQASFTGTAKIARTGTTHAQKVSFTVNVLDNGDPGTSDAFTISVSNGYSAGGRLTSGNILIH